MFKKREKKTGSLLIKEDIVDNSEINDYNESMNFNNRILY